MGNTIWRRRRMNAEIAGREAADGGNDRRAEFEEQGLGESYDKGFRERENELVQVRRYESHPLRAISREAVQIAENNGSVPQVARLIEQLADYLLEREDDGK